tara:strand:- start:372 stop:863 length:492 start_codon:yes stop_codon:yes gene_type:complete
MRFLIILILAINTIFSNANGHNDSNTNSTIIDEHHAHEAPHGGILIELGDHFGLMELLHDPNKGSLQAWFLDGCADNYVRLVKQKIKFVVHGRFLNKSVKETVSFELSPKANPLTGETRQSTSQYQLIHDQLKGVVRLKGMVLNVRYKGHNFKNLTFDTKPVD